MSQATLRSTTGSGLSIRRLFQARSTGVFAALVLLVIIGSVVSPSFFEAGNFLSVGQQVSQLGIMAVGSTFVLINGEIDLSVGSIYALTAILTGEMIAAGTSWVIASVIGLGLGTVAGLINGLVVVYFRIPSFIVTLGTLSVFRGVALLVSGGNPTSLSTSSQNVADFSLLGQGDLFGVIPMQLVFFIVFAIIGTLVLSRSRFGYNSYAVGGNVQAARLVGIRTGRIKVTSFVLSGFTAAVAGVLGLSFLSYVQGQTGTGLEIAVISGVIVGGAALSGGSGTMWGTIVGVVFIGVLQNILNINGVSPFVQTVITGLVIIAAVGIDTWQRRRRSSRT
jgi:ribose transport system permease protein